MAPTRRQRLHSVILDAARFLTVLVLGTSMSCGETTATTINGRIVRLKPAEVQLGELQKGVTREIRFELFNDGLTPLTIGRVAGSCGCQAFTVIYHDSTRPGASGETVVAAQDSAIVQVSLNVEAVGNRSHEVRVDTSKGSAVGRILLTGVANLQFDPATVVLDEVPAGSTRKIAARIFSTKARPFNILSVEGHGVVSSIDFVGAPARESYQLMAHLAVPLTVGKAEGAIRVITSAGTSVLKVRVFVTATVTIDPAGVILLGTVQENHESSASLRFASTNADPVVVESVAISAASTTTSALLELGWTSDSSKSGAVVLSLRVKPGVPLGRLAGLLLVSIAKPHLCQFEVPFLGWVVSK